MSDVAGVVGGVALLLAGTQERPPIRNLVLVTLDTLRADHVGCYGYFRDTTPHLDAFAAECLRFEQCFTPVAQTTPSHASLMTGVGPIEHGVLNNHGKGPDGEKTDYGLRTAATLQTLAQILAAQGVRTGGFVSATPAKKSTGLGAGFDRFTEPEEFRRSATTTLADAMEFLGEASPTPCFAWIHLYDDHGPYQWSADLKPYLTRYPDDERLHAWMKPRGFPERVTSPLGGEASAAHVINSYDGAVRFQDDQLESLFARLREPDLAASTVVVVVADHGTSDGQHDDATHGMCWEEQLQVPLLIKIPGHAPGVVATRLSTLDLWPTIAALAPELPLAPFLGQCAGSDALAPDYEPRPHFSFSAKKLGFYSVRNGRWKLLRTPNGREFLFDLDTDPNELAECTSAHADVVAKLDKLLDQELRREQKRRELHLATIGKGTGEIDPAIRAELEKLGYTDGDDSPAGAEPPAQPPVKPVKKADEQKTGEKPAGG